MNKSHLFKLTALILALGCYLSQAQTNKMPVVPSLEDGLQKAIDSLESIKVGNVTNYSFVPYATYAPEAPDGNKVGGGILAVYNVNNHLGAGVGVDYLGQFSLVSGNLSIKADIHPLKQIEFLNGSSWATNFTITPFAMAGVGKPLGGTSTGMAALADVGGQTKLGDVWGGTIGLGVCYGQWVNAGDYSVKRYHFFLSWQKGF